MKMLTTITSVAVAASFSVAFASPLAGIWTGSGEKDPISDQPSSLAITYDRRTEGSIALRCRNGKEFDILLSPSDPQFTPGEWQNVLIRFDSSDPLEVKGIATEPSILAIDHKRDEKVSLPFLRAKSITVRFKGLYGRQLTYQFASAMLPNTLNKVGRVLADCGMAPFPEEEIKKSTADLLDQPVKKQKRR